MKIKLFTLAVLSIFAFQVHAQNASLGIGTEISFPSGNSSNISAIGLGGNLKAEVSIADKFALTANGSVVSFLGKKLFGVRTPTFSAIPIKAGLKYYTSSQFYFEGQIGASIPLNGKTSTSFAWSPGFGTYLGNNGAKNNFDLGIRYESWTSTKFNFITLRVAYLLSK